MESKLGQITYKMSISFEEVNTQEKFDLWRKFAAEFGHDTDRPTMPIINVIRNGEQMAYFHVLKQPLVFPAFHPGKTSPRGFKEAVEAVSNVFTYQSMSPVYPNGVLFTALPAGNKQIVPDHQLYKLGLESLDVELYQKIPNGFHT